MWKRAVNFTSKGLIYIQLCNRDDSNICVWFNIYLGKSQNIATVRHYRFSRKTHNIASATVKNPKISTSFDQFDSFYTRKCLKKKIIIKMAGIYKEYSKTFVWKVAWHNTYSHGRFVSNRKNIHSLSLPSLSGFSTFKARLSLNLSYRYLSNMVQLTFLFRWIRHCSVSLLTTWYDHVTQKSAKSPERLARWRKWYDYYRDLKWPCIQDRIWSIFVDVKSLRKGCQRHEAKLSRHWSNDATDELQRCSSARMICWENL